jgi:hypothetical protein
MSEVLKEVLYHFHSSKQTHQAVLEKYKLIGQVIVRQTSLSIK